MKLSPKERKDTILTAALKVAAKPGGWARLTRESVAAEAQCSDALVSLYFGTMVSFRRTLMRAAIANNNNSIIGQGVACGDRYALKLSDHAKQYALQSLSA